MSQVFTYFIMIVDDIGERYFIQTVINEKSNTIAMQLTNLKTSWIGTLDENQIRNLAQKFPSETNDSFYSHTQRAFSQNNNNKSSKYTYSLKKIDKNRVEFIWKEKVDDLNILKTIGSIQLEERPNAEILEKLMSRTIEEIDTLQTVNQQKNEDIQRLNTQLTKALETIERTVDLKEKLEADLYKKFVLVLNTKKTELAKLRNQTDGRPLFEDDQQVVSNKRTRDEDTTDEDEKNESHPEPKIFHHRQDSSSLELGNDGMDYRASTIPKHHQRRKKPTTEIDPIRTRSFVRHMSNASVMPLPSLPDDSQTTDDMLEKI